MNLSNENDRTVAHMFVKNNFKGDYGAAVRFLNGLDRMNNVARRMLYSQKYGFIDVYLSGDK